MNGQIDGLNDRFGIEDKLVFKEGPGGFQTAKLTNGVSECSVTLHGAHVTEFRDGLAGDVLWTSRKSLWEKGRPIRGGVPVCWPWFGSRADGKNMPSHGFARLSDEWFVSETSLRPDGSPRLVLSLRTSDETRLFWNMDFELDLEVCVGKELSIALETRNTCKADMTCTAALHSYFLVGDISGTSVLGLEGKTFIDTADADRMKKQEGPVRFSGETDNIYLDTIETCVIDDPALSRQITVAKHGSNSTVVWNPWIEKSKRMSDFGDEEYKEMLCVETAKAREDIIFLPPGASHSLKAVISAKKL